jgi:hypothetical protein
MVVRTVFGPKWEWSNQRWADAGIPFLNIEGGFVCPQWMITEFECCVEAGVTSEDLGLVGLFICIQETKKIMKKASSLYDYPGLMELWWGYVSLELSRLHHHWKPNPKPYTAVANWIKVWYNQFMHRYFKAEGRRMLSREREYFEDYDFYGLNLHEDYQEFSSPWDFDPEDTYEHVPVTI